jgi:hypothetical protein
MPSGLQGARAIGQAPDPIHVSDAAALVLLVGLELVAVWLVVRIWREHGRSMIAKVLWSLVTLVPVLGLIAWAAWRDPPPPNDPTDRATRRDWDTPA